MKKAFILVSVWLAAFPALGLAAGAWSVVSVDAEKNQIVVKDATTAVNRTLRVHAGDVPRFHPGDPVPDDEVESLAREGSP
jgi:hypothetical protein